MYLNELDQFVKHALRIRHYVRYTDDFIIVGETRKFLEGCLAPLQLFLENQLRLSLHPKKVIIRKYHQGVDFLGYVLLPHYRVLRTKTRKRIFRKLAERMAAYDAGSIEYMTVEQSLQSYLGVLSHANAHGLSKTLRNTFFPRG